MGFSDFRGNEEVVHRLRDMMPQPSSQADFSRAAVSEEEVNSEVELLRDDEVLRRVAEKNGLARPGLLASFHIQQEDVHAQVERASRKLAAQIIVEPIRKTSLIQVHYRSSDPAQAARVLNSLAAEYSAKHGLHLLGFRSSQRRKS